KRDAGMAEASPASRWSELFGGRQRSPHRIDDGRIVIDGPVRQVLELVMGDSMRIDVALGRYGDELGVFGHRDEGIAQGRDPVLGNIGRCYEDAAERVGKTIELEHAAAFL